MIRYVAAFATAVTLMITPVMVEAKDSQTKKKPVQWTKPVDAARTLQVQKPIEISGSRAPYVLSELEQEVLRRTLLRSVKIVHLGKLA